MLSLIVSYQLSKPQIGKLIYCTRTVQEMDKVMQEIKRVFKYIDKALYGLSGDGGDVEMKEQGVASQQIKKRKNLCVCLSARRNLCIHDHVSQFDDPSKVDSLCRNRTASWIRNVQNVPKSALCDYYEGIWCLLYPHSSAATFQHPCAVPPMLYLECLYNSVVARFHVDW